MKKKKKPNTKAPVPYPFKGSSKPLVYGPIAKRSGTPKPPAPETKG